MVNRTKKNTMSARRALPFIYPRAFIFDVHFFRSPHTLTGMTNPSSRDHPQTGGAYANREGSYVADFKPSKGGLNSALNKDVKASVSAVSPKVIARQGVLQSSLYIPRTVPLP